MYGVHGGVGIAKHVRLLGEFDWATSLPTVVPTSATSNTAFVEATHNLTNGLFAMGRFDYFNPDLSLEFLSEESSEETKDSTLMTQMTRISTDEIK